MLATARHRVTSATLDPALSTAFRHVYDVSKETSYGDGVAIDTLTDRGARALGKTLTGVTTARPLCVTGAINGMRCARFDGTDDVLKSATVADWRWLGDGRPLTIFIVFRTNTLHVNAHGFLLSTNSNASSASIGYSVSLDDRAASSRLNRVNIAHCTGGGTTADFASTQDHAYNDMRWNLLGIRYAADPRAFKDSLTSTLIRNVIELNGTICQATNLVAQTNTWPAQTTDPTTALQVGASGVAPVAATFFTGDIAYIALADTELSDETYAAYRRYIENYFALAPSGTVIDTSRICNIAPSCESLLDGTLVVEYSKRNYDNFFSDETIVQKRSGNKGRTWSVGRVQQWQAGVLCQITDLIRLRGTNTLLRSYAVWNNAAATDIDAFTQRSTDGGRTWGTPESLSGHFSGVRAQSMGFTQLDNGNVLLGIYGLDSPDTTLLLSKSVISTDGGQSWGTLATIKDGRGSSINAFEPTLVALTGANVLAFWRQSPTILIAKAASSDGGVTWGASSTLISGYNGTPKVLKATSGNLYLLLRLFPSSVQDSYILRYSTDGGTTWSTNDFRIDGKRGNSALTDMIEYSPGLFFLATANAPTDTVTSFGVQEVCRGIWLKESDILLYT